MKKNIIMLSGVIVFLLITYIGMSLALFQKVETQEGTNSITTLNCLNVSITGGNSINLQNAYPMRDEDGVLQVPYTFTLTNNCDNYVAADIGVEILSSTISAEVIKASMNKKYEGPFAKALTSYEFTQDTDTETGQPTGNVKYIMLHDGISARKSNSYEFRMWIDYDVTELTKNLNFNVKIITNSAIRTSEPHGWSNSAEGTLLYALKRDNEVKEPLGALNAISLEGEDVFASAPDDYGTSYYFRGDVKNNYLVFANKCWRIVRVTGDGSIKLVLHNNDSTECNINDNTLNFAKYDGVNNQSAFIDSSHTYTKLDTTTGQINLTALGVGFMYGDPTADNYAAAQANLHDSTILTNLKKWYDLEGTFTESEKNMLADVIWCNDKSTTAENTGYGEVATTYAGNERATEMPSMICTNLLSKFTAYDTDNGNGALNGYKIGLLTLDEAKYAGGDGWSASENSNYYLYNNKYYWLLTPRLYSPTSNNSNARVMQIYSGGGISNGNSASSTPYVRPSVALSSTVKIQDNGADGTISKPYIVVSN